jgi:hypothetical protein
MGREFTKAVLVNPTLTQKLGEMGARLFGRKDAEGEAKKWGIDPGVVRSQFWPAAQMAQKYPSLWPAIDVAYSYYGIKNAAARQIAEPILVDSGGLIKTSKINEELTHMTEMITKPALEEAASAIGMLKQVEERVLTDSEMRGHLSHLSEADQNKVIQFHRSVEMIMPRAAQLIVDSFHQEFGLRTARLLMSVNDGMTRDQAVRYGNQIMNSAMDAARGNQQAAVLGTMQLPPEVKSETAWKMAAAFAEKVVKLEKQVSDRPWFMSEMRMGRFYAAWKDPETGRRDVFAGKTKEEVDKFVAEKLIAKGVAEGSIRRWDKFDRRNDFSGLAPGLAEVMKEFETGAINKVFDDLGIGQGLRDRFFEEYTPIAASVKERMGSGTERHFMSRKKTLLQGLGAQEVNMPLGVLQYID